MPIRQFPDGVKSVSLAGGARVVKSSKVTNKALRPDNATHHRNSKCN